MERGIKRLFTNFRHSPKDTVFGEDVQCLTSTPSPNTDLVDYKAFHADVNGTDELDEIVQRRCWTLVKPTGSVPRGRSNHATTVIGRRIYIVGGDSDGRRLNDVHVLHLGKLTWTELGVQQTVTSSSQILPPCRGHSLISWGKTVLLVGGDMLTATERVPVWSFDLEAECWTRIQAKGNIPVSRSGHSVTRAGSILIMFGGEDIKGRKLNDIHVLDLKSLIWLPLNTKGKCPSPRARHVSVMHNDRYLLVFGGASKSKVLNDLYALDFETMEWSRLKPDGFLPPPRSGSAGVLYDGKWYICGGGDQNGNKICETVTLDISKMMWTNVVKSLPNSVVATQGLSLVMVQKKERVFLVAFGGSGTTSNTNEVEVLYIPSQVMKYAPTSPPKQMVHSSTKDLVVPCGNLKVAMTVNSPSEQKPATWSSVYRSPPPDSNVPGFVPLRRLHQQASPERYLPRQVSPEKVVTQMQQQVSPERHTSYSTNEHLHHPVEERIDTSNIESTTGESETSGNMSNRHREDYLQSSISSAQRDVSLARYYSDCESNFDTTNETILKLKDGYERKLEEIMENHAAQIEAMSKEKQDVMTRLNQVTKTQEATEEKLATTLSEMQGLRIQLEASERAQEESNSLSNIVHADNLRLERDINFLKSLLQDTQKELHSAKGVIASERSRAFQLQVELYDLKQKKMQT